MLTPKIFFVAYSSKCFLFNITEGLLPYLKHKVINKAQFSISDQPVLYYLNEKSQLSRKNFDGQYLILKVMSFTSIEKDIFDEFQDKYYYKDQYCYGKENYPNYVFTKTQIKTEVKPPIEHGNLKIDMQDLSDRYSVADQYQTTYPKILIPENIQKQLRSKPKYAEPPKQFTEISKWGVIGGAASLLALATPIGWLGLIAGAGAIYYDSIRYDSELEKANQHNQEVAKILNDHTALIAFLTQNQTEKSLCSSTAQKGRYDEILLRGLSRFQGCIVKSGQGLFRGGSYPYTPDIILHVPPDLYIDIEVDEPWHQGSNTNYKKKASHYIGKDSDRNRFFLDANWIVIRFAEQQVATELESCRKIVAELLQNFGLNYTSHFQNIPDLRPVKCWTADEALNISRNFS